MPRCRLALSVFIFLGASLVSRAQVSSGTVEIPGTFLFDFDAGVIPSTISPAADMFWEQFTSTTRAIEPYGGATIANLGTSVNFSSLTPAQLQALTYSSSGIDGSNGTNLTGVVFAVHTNSGNYAKAVVTKPLDPNQNNGLIIQWVTYAPIPVVTSITPNGGVQGANVQVILTGANFKSGSSVNVANSGVTVSAINVVSSTQITANLAIAVNAAIGATNVTVTTSGGTSAPVSFTVSALTVSVTVTTIPSGLQVMVDGNTLTAPQTLQWASSSSHVIGITSPQGGGGTQYAFSNWSDGGGQTHTVTAPSSPVTYTASFKTQYQLTMSASPVAGGTVTPAGGSFYDSATAVPISATASSGYSFTSWTGSVASATSASTTVTMSAPQTVTANFVQSPGTVTIRTNPPGLQFSVEGGAPLTAPQTLSLSQGSHTIAVATMQPGTAGTQYVFTSWSDNGAASHSITVGASASTYTASFKAQYQLMVSASPVTGGTVTPAGGSFYDSGTAVPISATANSGYSFTGWTGSVGSAISASTTVTMSAPQTVTANFATSTGVTIQTNPPGLQFSVDGGAPQTAPQTLSLSQGSHTIAVATTQPGTAGTQYVFTSWSDNGAASHSITVGASASTYTASFKAQYQLMVSASPVTGGTVTPAGGSFYDSGTAVPISATANSGYSFTGWTGSVASATSASTTATMSAPQTVMANFATSTGVTIQTNPPGLQFSVDGGAPQTAPQSFTWTPGSSHSIGMSSPQGGGGTQYVFSNWSDGGGQIHTVTAPSSATTYTANFMTQYLLTPAELPGSGGTVTATPSSTNGYYAAGTSVQLTATSTIGYQFANWSGDLSGSANPQSVTMSAPRNVTANFSSLAGVTVTTNPSGFQIVVDGSTVTAPQSFSWMPGSNHTIGAITPQGSGGIRSVFTNWSDGGAATHTIAAPSIATTYAASFKTQYVLTTTVSPPGAGSVAVNPSSADGYYDAGISLQVTASPAASYQFQNWSGDLSGSTNPQPGVMNAPRSVTANFALASGGGVTITTASVPNGFMGVVYQTTTLQAQGGTAPYGWSVTGLPAGLSLSTGGVLSGTPVASGPFQITVTVNDSSTPNALTATRNYNGTVSVPTTLLTVSTPALSFFYVEGDPNQPGAQSIGVFSSPTGTGVTASAATTDGGSWLNLSTSFSQGNRTPATTLVSVNPARLAPNVYSGQVTIAAPNATPPSVTVNVILTVTAASPPALSITPTTQSFAIVQGGQPVQGQVTVSNSGGGTLPFSAQANSDANWLTLPGNGSGVATPSSAASLGFTVNPGAGLTAGLHRGQITVTDTSSGTQKTAAVTLLVNDNQQTIQLSQAGLTFTAVANAVTLPSQSFSVFNLGQGSMAWTTQAQTIPPGQSWLRVAAASASGSSAPGSPGQVTISVNQTGLAAGQYYGIVKVLAPSAANTSQSVSVLLNVVQPGQLGSAPQVSTGGLVLAGVAASAASVQQDLALFNPTGTALSYSAGVFTEDGSTWLTIGSSTGKLSETGTGKLTILANPTGVTGVKQGTVQVAFSEGTVHTVGVALLATGGSSGSSSVSLSLKSDAPNAASGCQPKALVPKFQAPEQSQSIAAARPQKLQVQVLDDCGGLLVASGATVHVTFSNNDPGVDLRHEGGGIWAGTWTPANAQAQIRVQVNAFQTLANGSVLAGYERLNGLEVLPANGNDAAQPLGALNAASLDKSNVGLVVPGSYVAIYGSRLADSTSQPNGLPLPCNLSNAQLLLSDQCIPLSFASPQQVNALIPQNLPLNTVLQLFIQRGNTGSVPVAVTVTDLQPGVFTTTQNGQGQGAIVVSGTGFVAGPVGPRQRPVKRGEYLEIYCTGLGSVQGTKGEGPLADGVPAPAGGSPLYKTVAPVNVTIGGVPAQVVFAGLAPSFVGLYQVNVQVSTSTPIGDTVSLVVTMTGQSGAVSSPPVTIAVQ